MGLQQKNQFIYTVKDRCKVCYTCVRECPAKAIRIVNGQAEIIENRCIACGNCVKVCSRQAKMYSFAIDRVKKLVQGPHKVAAIIAPSIAAEFIDIPDYQILVGMIRTLGFEYVNEVAFGAELVANQYKETPAQRSETSLYFNQLPCHSKLCGKTPSPGCSISGTHCISHDCHCKGFAENAW
jgi:ferredoxin